MPRYTTSQTYTDGNTQIVPLPDQGGANNQIVEFKGDAAALQRKDDEDLEEKLRRISDQVPVRISNTSGSSAGSGSGDFHQYRQMRRREQDRLARMDVDYQKRQEEADFLARREERMRASEERTAKKRAKRLKKKETKRQKKLDKAGIDQAPSEEGNPQLHDENQSSESEDSEVEKRGGRPPLPTKVAADHSVVQRPHIFVKKSFD